MNNPIGICTWSLHNDLQDVTKVMQSSGLKHLHLAVDAIDAFADVIKAENWIVSSTMVAFPQEDYSTMDRIRLTGGIIPDECWLVNREIAMDAIRKTAEMGVPCLSTHAGFIDHNDKHGYALFRERMLGLADAAKQHGIELIMETGQETAIELKHCLEDLNHPAIGVNFDPANMILYDKGDPIEAVHILAPWIRHVHIKDATRTQTPGEWGTEVAWGDGEVPHEEFLNTLEKIGFNGALAIEREAGDQRLLDIKHAAELLLKLS